MNFGQKPYHSLDYEMKQRFGTKVYKIALDGGMTCPNRDGSLGTRGCIFCSGGGSGEFAEPVFSKGNPVRPSPGPMPLHEVLASDLNDQIRRASARINKKLGASPKAYIAYFQSYTNTYAPVSYLRSLFTAAISHPDVRILSIATRPDCLPDETLKLCAELNQKKPVWLELGLQTIHEPTAVHIRRGYPLSCFTDALHRLRSYGLEAIVHVILGLPGENRKQMLQTIEYLAHQDIQGIKLQLLHILQGTDLAFEYQHHPFPVLSMEEYIDLIIDCIALLPPKIIVHRITGDGPKRLLVAPLWSSNKRQVLNLMDKRFRERGITQGCRFSP
ncbi:MAG: TIGR01212 family radical SAM protein [Lachnospiraceae bacterium]|jgi:radical SAM protein (TIGR01212 family)|nr:TIGR01212 family radical SAM protein [Lachnospiraceae bacterium]